MNKNFHILIIIFLINNYCIGQTIISFSNITYAGETINLITKDYLSDKDSIIASSIVDENGNCKFELNLNNTIKIRIPLFFFEGIIYTKPNTEYFLNLPRKTEIPIAAQVSPFFSPMIFFAYLPENNPSELNNAIFEFDELYEKYIEDNYSRIIFEGYRFKLEPFIQDLNNKFDSINDDYFIVYKRSRLAMLKYMSSKRDQNYLIKEYINPYPVAIYNNAYMDLINNVFKDYLRLYSQQSMGERLFNDISRAKSPKAIKETLMNNIALTNNELIELIIIKGLHDAFYQRDANIKRNFPFKQMELTLDSLLFLNETYFTKQLVQNVKNKINNIIKPINLVGFELTDCKGNKKLLEDYRGKYVYTVFFDTRNFTCLKELNMLKTRYNKHKNDITFIVFIVNGDITETKDFCKKNSLELNVLHVGNNEEFKKFFEIKAIPTYMFFNPYGELVTANAPSPSENFEATLFRLLEK